MITGSQAFEIAMAIIHNEAVDITELSDQMICMYLVDRGVDETEENINAIRRA